MELFGGCIYPLVSSLQPIVLVFIQYQTAYITYALYVQRTVRMECMQFDIEWEPFAGYQ